jgi:prefoldin beta subunit
MAEVSPQVQNQLAQYQQLQQQVQLITSQKVQLEAQLNEIELTLNELNNVTPDTPIYKSIGSLLIKVKDKETVKKELEEQKDTVTVRVKTLERQEGHLRERLENLQTQLAKVLRTE